MTMAVLSWGAHQTLINTLQSYEDNGLDDSQKLIFFQEISKDDIQIAEFFEYDYIGEKTNIGIGQALRRLVDEATGDFFLFLENDWKLIEKAQPTISQAKLFISAGMADCVKLRHRKLPGNPLWSRQFAGNELSRPEYLLDCLHWEEYPEKFQEIQKVNNWYFTTSQYANFTNNPCMYKTEFVRKNIYPFAGGPRISLEVDIQDWWAKNNFKVVQGDGLFTHYRID